MNQIDIDGAELKICRDCVDELWMGGKPDKLKNVQYITVYRTEKSQEDKEEVEGAVIGDGSEDISIVYVLYPRGIVSVS